MINFRPPFKCTVLACAVLNKSTNAVMVRAIDGPDVVRPYAVFKVDTFGTCGHGEYFTHIEGAIHCFTHNSVLKHYFKQPNQRNRATA